MSKVDILAELSNLKLEDRREIFERIGELEEHDLLHGGEPMAEEKALLDRELEEYRAHPEAGAAWNEVEARFHLNSSLVGDLCCGKLQNSQQDDKNCKAI